MSNLAYLEQIIGTIYGSVDDCFELSGHLLTNPMVTERIDKVFVLQESIGDLRRVAARLELLKSRMEGEKSGVNGQNEGS